MSVDKKTLSVVAFRTQDKFPFPHLKKYLWQNPTETTPQDKSTTLVASSPGGFNFIVSYADMKNFTARVSG